LASFCQEKEESPSAASRGKPSAAENSQFKTTPPCGHPSNGGELQTQPSYRHPARLNSFPQINKIYAESSGKNLR